MNEYTYILDIRLYHPSVDPEQVSQTLGMTPKNKAKAGEPRFTPKGRRLEGVHSQSYWSCDPFDMRWCSSHERSVDDALVDILEVLEPHSDVLLELARDGRNTIWFSSHSNRNFTIEIPPDTLARLAALKISLVHDVYQGE
mgnify:CR=1 FL=1